MWQVIWIGVSATLMTAALVSMASSSVSPLSRASLPLRVLIVNPWATAIAIAFALSDTTHPPSPRIAYVVALALCAVVTASMLGLVALPRLRRRFRN